MKKPRTGDQPRLLRFLGGEPVTAGKHRHRCICMPIQFDINPGSGGRERERRLAEKEAALRWGGLTSLPAPLVRVLGQIPFYEFAWCTRPLASDTPDPQAAWHNLPVGMGVGRCIQNLKVRVEGLSTQ